MNGKQVTLSDPPQEKAAGSPKAEEGKPQGPITRKDFLKVLVGGGAAVALAGVSSESSAQENQPRTKKRYGMVIDLLACVGCRACSVACKAENHTPPGVAYCVVMEEEIGQYPYVRRQFISRPCMHCSKTACTYVCPTRATYRRDDGIVVIDY